jgi:hypothetical protein
MRLSSNWTRHLSSKQAICRFESCQPRQTKMSKTEEVETTRDWDADLKRIAELHDPSILENADLKGVTPICSFQEQLIAGRKTTQKDNTKFGDENCKWTPESADNPAPVAYGHPLGEDSFKQMLKSLKSEMEKPEKSLNG